MHARPSEMGLTGLVRCTSFRYFCPEELSSLSHLQHLRLNAVQAEDFDVPSTWRNLQTLDLKDNMLSRIPSGLPALHSLRMLDLREQAPFDTSFQLGSSLHFVTMLQQLTSVLLSQAEQATAWTPVSLAILAEAHLLIEDTPGCHVKLSE